MNVKTGLEIVGMHEEYAGRIKELEEAMAKLDDYGYTKIVLQTQLNNLREDVRVLENTRFQALEPVTVPKSALGGHDFYIS
jgi:surfactin synthase thioesterase subunit